MATDLVITKNFFFKLMAFVLFGNSLMAQAVVTTLHDLVGTEGRLPHGQLIQGRDGNLYGTTSSSSTIVGNAFRITPTGAYKVMHAFIPKAGSLPPSPSVLMLGLDGNFYGTTTNGNAAGGAVFKMTPAGVVTVLHQFGAVLNDGYSIDNGILRPTPPVQTADGTLYGTTTSGGLNGVGIVYKLTTTGIYSIIHHFVFGATEGSRPSASLVVGNDGNLYGTSTIGGQPTGTSGTVFRITPSGIVKTLYNFNAFDDGGYQPQAPLVKGVDGNFYGTTFGRADLSAQGNIFKITPAGVYTNLHSLDFFHDVTDGAYPNAGLVEASDGFIYGVNSRGGVAPGLFANDAGVVFNITKLGLYDVTHTFDKAIDGARPLYSLVQHTNGKLYGTTQFSKTGLVPAGNGSVFSLDVGARPFALAQPSSGKAGGTIGLFGNFTGVTSITFNGIPATSAGVGNTYRTVTIPAGAATGVIKINKPTGSVSGLNTFLVRPVFTSFSPASGKVGTVVALTGKSLSQTTAVTFSNGKKAVFTLVSDNQLNVNVPVGVVTGKISITTKGGTVASATNFSLIP
ncbi:MAG: choice-of-anchor tandem repeat GloVer-containing protein [Methyloglobulus sp.]